MQNKKVYSLLGLAARGRNVVSGEFMTEKAVKSGRAALVIVSEEASDNTQKMFADMCDYHNVSYRVFGSKEELGHSMGKQMRASLAVTDKGFAESIRKLLADGEKETDR